MISQNSIVGDGMARRPRESPVRRTLASGRLTRNRVVVAAVVASIAALALITLVPADRTIARPTFEGGLCGAPDGCHDGAQTPSMMTVTGLPSGTFIPGQQYTVTITITDTNGATGQNAFDLLVTAGTLSTTDANAEINTPTVGYNAEASANDAVSPMTATVFTVVWTAPSSGSATVDVWAVMGDGSSGTHDIWDHETTSYSAIPEFPTLLIPVIGAVGALVLASRISKKKG